MSGASRITGGPNEPSTEQIGNRAGPRGQSNPKPGGPAEAGDRSDDDRWGNSVEQNSKNFHEPRWKRYEKRKAAKRAIWHAETNINDMADMLHDEGYLDDWRIKNRAEIQDAFQCFINGHLRVRGCDVPE